MAGALLPAGDALALWGDRLELFAQERIGYESNIFRLSDGTNTQALLGTSDRSDTFYTTSLGLNLNVPVSRQRFLAGYSHNMTRYNRFSDLNFDGHEGRAIWQYQVGNELSGQIGYTQTEALASFANIQSRQPNPLKVEQTFGNGEYLLTPRWRLRGALAQLQQRNGAAARQVNDIDVTSSEGAVSYVTPAQNSIGVSIRGQEADYPNRQPVAGLLLDNHYTQRGLGVIAEWNVTAISRLTGRVDTVKRSFSQLSQRDYRGTTARAAHDWRPTGRFSMNTIVQRDISAVEDVQTAFVLVTGISFLPTYAISDKLSLTGNVDYAQRQFKSDPNFVLTGATERKDRLQVYGATLTWRPTRTISALLGLQHEKRTSNITGFDYSANVVSLTGRIGF